MERKLGRLPRKDDKRTLKFGKYLTGLPLPASPPLCQWSKFCNPDFGMMMNDRLGDCTVAALGHSIQTWTASHGAGLEVTVPDQEILRAYIMACGYNPNLPETDRGGYMLDVLKYVRKTGIAQHRLGAFVALDMANHSHLESAMHLFGGVYVGLSLPLSAQGQIVWDVPWYGARFRGTPGSWGGHAVWICDYSRDKKLLWCVTWGQLQPLTYRFLDTYANWKAGGEGYCLLSPDWVAPNHPSPSGFDLSTLTIDLNRVTR